MLDTEAPEEAAGPGGRPEPAGGLPAAGPAGRRVSAFRRMGWGVIDQGMSSITNFAVVLYVARLLGAEQLGAFSLAYVTYGFALNVSRGLSTEPMVIRFSNSDIATWRRAVAGSTGTATVTGIVCGALTIGAAAFLKGTSREAFFALGLTLPVLLLQDSWRFAFFALGRGGQAFISDTIWAVALVPALLLVTRTGHKNVFWLLLAWGGAAGVAAAVGPFQARVIPRLTDTRLWLSQHRDLGPRYVAENASGNIAIQGRTYGLGIILGLTSVGYLQAASTLVGPFQVLFFGISIVVVAEAARVLHRSPERLVRFCVLISVGLSAAGLLYGVAIVVALPLGVGQLLLPALWHQTYPLVLPSTLGLLAGSASAGATAGLRALGAAKRSMIGGLSSAVAYLVLSIAGGLIGGAIWSLLLGSLAAMGNAVYLWVQLRAALQDYNNGRAQNQMGGRRRGRHRKPAPAERKPAGA